MTAQIRDNIEYNGRKMGVSCDISIRKHPRIRYVENGERDAFLTGSTACWRGYIASWKIQDNKLFLTGLEDHLEIIGEAPLPATWVSEKIRLTAGDAVEYVHMRYASTFEHDIVLKVKKGRVVRIVKETEDQSTDEAPFHIW